MGGFFRRLRRSKSESPEEDPEPPLEEQGEPPKFVAFPEDERPPEEHLEPVPEVTSEPIDSGSVESTVKTPELESAVEPVPPTPQPEKVVSPPDAPTPPASPIPPAPPEPAVLQEAAKTRPLADDIPPPPLPRADPEGARGSDPALAPLTRCFLCGTAMEGDFCPNCRMNWKE